MALRILSYNILAGGEDRIPLIANVIQKQKPDVVALLEARSRSNAEALAKQLGMSLTIGEATNINKDHVAWLSRLPIMRTKNHRLPGMAKTLIEIEILWDGTPIALFATHLKAGQSQDREHFRVTEMQVILELLHSHRNQLASSNSSTGLRMLIPALLTRMSMRPNSLTTVWIIVSICSASVTSTAIPIARCPVFSASVVALFIALSSWRLVTTTFAPASARALAIANPNPRLPPVINATRPSSLNTSRDIKCMLLSL